MSLASERAALASVIAAGAGVACHPNIPDRIVPDCVVMTPADPWITDAGYGRARVRLEVFILLGKGTNAAQVDRMEALTVSVLSTVVGDTDWGVEEVTAPHTAEIGGLNLLATRLTVATEIDL